MKQIELFYLTRCPYCKKARQAIEELVRETPAYAEIEILWIEESEQPELANSRNYYSVPTIFFRGEKLYEAKPFHSYEIIKENIQVACDRILSA